MDSGDSLDSLDDLLSMAEAAPQQSETTVGENEHGADSGISVDSLLADAAEISAPARHEEPEPNPAEEPAASPQPSQSAPDSPAMETASLDALLSEQARGEPSAPTATHPADGLDDLLASAHPQEATPVAPEPPSVPSSETAASPQPADEAQASAPTSIAAPSLEDLDALLATAEPSDIGRSEPVAHEAPLSPTAVDMDDFEAMLAEAAQPVVAVDFQPEPELPEPVTPEPSPVEQGDEFEALLAEAAQQVVPHALQSGAGHEDTEERGAATAQPQASSDEDEGMVDEGPRPDQGQAEMEQASLEPESAEEAAAQAQTDSQVTPEAQGMPEESTEMAAESQVDAGEQQNAPVPASPTGLPDVAEGGVYEEPSSAVADSPASLAASKPEEEQPAPNLLETHARAVDAATQANEATTHAVTAWEQAFEASSRAAEAAEAVNELTTRLAQCEQALQQANQRVAELENMLQAQEVRLAEASQRPAPEDVLGALFEDGHPLHDKLVAFMAMTAQGALEQAEPADDARLSRCEHELQETAQRLAVLEQAEPADDARLSRCEHELQETAQRLAVLEQVMPTEDSRVVQCEHGVQDLGQRLEVLEAAVQSQAKAVLPSAETASADAAALEEHIRTVATVARSNAARMDALEERVDALEPVFNERVEKAAAAAAARVLREEIGRLLEQGREADTANGSS